MARSWDSDFQLYTIADLHFGIETQENTRHLNLDSLFNIYRIGQMPSHLPVKLGRLAFDSLHVLLRVLTV